MMTETKRIKCAHCKDYHDSIQGVRDCSRTSQARQVFLTDSPTPPPAQPAHVTLRQNKEAESIPSGRYAVEVDGVLGFFQLDAPTEGRWAGRIFLKQMASDDEYSVYGRRKHQVIHLIAANPAEASIRYGQELKFCGVCGRPLTKAESRAAGIGPICRANMGW